MTNDRRKLGATVLFLSAIRHRKVIHVNFFVFFCHIGRTGTVFVEIQKGCYHGSVK